MKRLVIAAMLALSPSVAFAQVGCFIGGSVGGGITQTETPGITIAANGGMIGVEGGCDYKFDKFLVGGLARADFSDIKTSVTGNTVKQDAAWTLALRAGYQVQPDVLVYVIGGYTGTSIDYAGLVNIDRNGFLGGAGLELRLVGNMFGFVEYTHTEYRKWSDGVTGDFLKPSQDAARVGVRLKF